MIQYSHIANRASEDSPLVQNDHEVYSTRGPILEANPQIVESHLTLQDSSRRFFNNGLGDCRQEDRERPAPNLRQAPRIISGPISNKYEDDDYGMLLMMAWRIAIFTALMAVGLLISFNMPFVGTLLFKGLMYLSPTFASFNLGPWTLLSIVAGMIGGTFVGIIHGLIGSAVVKFKNRRNGY